MSLAEPPRTPSREERRSVLDALDAHYVTKKQCYAASFSDKAIGEKCNVPWAWVSEIREQFYGPDACEADQQKDEALLVLESRAIALEAKGMELAEQAETLRADIRRLREGKLAKAS